MSIRKAEIHDAQEIKDLVYSLSDFYLENKTLDLPLWFSNTLTLLAFKQRLSTPEYSNFIYSENNSIVGYISIKGENHLYHLFVSKERHGKGISRRLWSHATSVMNSSRYTVRSSLYGVPIYRSFGFKESKPVVCKDGISFQSMELECIKF